MGELSDWLSLMLSEISRKQDEAARADAELARRGDPAGQHPPPSGPPPAAGDSPRR